MTIKKCIFQTASKVGEKMSCRTKKQGGKEHIITITTGCALRERR